MNPKPQRWHHLPSGVLYRLAEEKDGVLTLESISRGSIKRRREELDNSECWRKMP